MVTLTSQVVAAGVRAGLLIENYATVAALVASTGSMTEGDEVVAGGYRYIVAATGANDHHITTAGGVKLYAQPDAAGGYNVKALGAAGDGTTDDAAVFALDFDQLVVDPGTYRIGSNTTVTAALRFLQGGKIKPDSAVTVTLNEGYEATDWQHVFDISAGGKVIGVRSARDYITPQHFGALADGSNDDATALSAACNFAELLLIRDDFAQTLSVGLPIPKTITQFYRLASTVYITKTVRLFGMGPWSGRYTGGVEVRPDSGLLAGIVFLQGGGANNPTTAATYYEPSNPDHNDPWKVHSGGFLYTCKQAHTSGASTEPGVGASWTTYWTKETLGDGVTSSVEDETALADAWVTGTAYNVSPGVGTTGTAAGSCVSNITIRPTTAGTVRFGFVHNCPVNFDGCLAIYFEQAGFCARGQSGGAFLPLENIAAPIGSTNSVQNFARVYNGSTCVLGNVNNSSYRNCRASGQTGGHGFYCAGNNAGVIYYENCDASGNKGAGFCDNSSVGSNYAFNHTAQNVLTVYETDSDQRYMCIKGHTSDTSVTKPGSGSDWRRYWVESLDSTLSDANWADATFYVPCGGVNISNGTLGYATILGHYSEGGIEVGIVPRGRTMVFAGSTVAPTTGRGPEGARIVTHPEFEAAQVLHQTGAFLNSFGRLATADPYGTPYDVSIWFGSYSTLGDPNGDRIMSFGDGRDDPGDGPRQTVRLAFSNTTKAYQFVRGSAVTTPLMAFSGADFSRGGYTGGTHFLAPTGILVGAGNANTSNYVKLAAVNASDAAGAATALSGQTVVRGQRWYFTSATAGGAEGVVCTTAGVVGTDAVLKAFGSIAP